MGKVDGRSKLLEVKKEKEEEVMLSVIANDPSAGSSSVGYNPSYFAQPGCRSYTEDSASAWSSRPARPKNPRPLSVALLTVIRL